MRGNQRGVAGSWPQLSLIDVTILDSAKTGYMTCGGAQHLVDAVIANAGSTGVAVTDCDGLPTTLTLGGSIAFNQYGGAVFWGNVYVTVQGSTIQNNRVFGVLALEAKQVLVKNSVIKTTEYGPVPGIPDEVGDGLVSSHSYVGLSEVLVTDNARVGVLLTDESVLSLYHATVTKNRFGLVFGDSLSDVNDLGGNSIAGNYQQDKVGGDLPVPNAPLDVPEAP